MKYIKLITTIALLAMMLTPSFAQDNDEADDTIKIVYQCDFADPKRVHLMLNTLNNAVKYYHDELIPYEIDIVALGPCLQYMMKDFKGTGFARKPYLTHGGPTGAGIIKRFKNLQLTGADNIEMFACHNTMTKKNVKAEQLEDYAKVTPAGVIKVVNLQRKGFAYIKIK